MKKNFLANVLFLHKALGRSGNGVLFALLVAVLAVNIWTLKVSWDKRLAEAGDEAMNLSVSLSRQAEDTFMQVEFTLKDVMHEIEQSRDGNISTPEMRGFLRERQKRLLQLNGIFIYDDKGRWLAASSEKLPANANNADRAYFIYHRDNEDQDIRIGHVIRSRSSDELVIPVSLRRYDRSGNFAGVVLATVRVDYFRKFYNYFELAERDALALILADTTVLYARPFPDSVINQSLAQSPLFKTALKHADSGSRSWHSPLDGIERIYGYARLHRFPLVVTAGYDKATLWQKWLTDHLLSLALNTALLATVLGMGVAILRQTRVHKHNQHEISRMQGELSNANQTLHALALLDEMTGLASRKQFDIFLEEALRRSRNSGRPVSVVIAGIDGFQHYNDTLGHEAGNKCLRQVGTALRDMPLSNTDLVAHYGGDRFAFVLPNTSSIYAFEIAMRAVSAVRHCHLPDVTDAPGRSVTISAGCSTRNASNSDMDAAMLVHQVESALLDAKRKGKNQASQR